MWRNCSLRLWKTVEESVPEYFTSPLEDCHSLRLWKTVKESVSELFTSPLQEDPGYITVVVPTSSVRCGDLGPLPEADETAWTISTVLRELHPWQDSDSKHWLSTILPPTTAIIGYTTRLRKLSANWVFRWRSNDSKFVADNCNGWVLLVFLFACFLCLCVFVVVVFWGITANIAYARTNKAQIERERMFMCVLGRYVTSTVLLVPKPFGGGWQRRWTDARR